MSGAQGSFLINELGQPISFPTTDWRPAKHPSRTVMEGTYCVVEPIDGGRHTAQLYAANSEDREGRTWTYLPYGPFDTEKAYTEWMLATCMSDDPLVHAIVDRRSGRAVGLASYMRIEPGVGVVEVGGIHYSPSLQRTAAATEAMYLMMRRAFDDLGYRRYEWKCDALNAGSRRAAERLGFSFEGVFRQALMYKGRNRDTAWYSILDRDWPSRRLALERWLDAGNFDEEGQQRCSLSKLLAELERD